MAQIIPEEQANVHRPLMLKIVQRPPRKAGFPDEELVILPLWAADEMLALQRHPEVCQFKGGACQCARGAEGRARDCTAQKADILWRAEAHIQDTGESLIEEPPSGRSLPDEFEIYLERVESAYWLHFRQAHSFMCWPVEILGKEDDLGDFYDMQDEEGF